MGKGRRYWVLRVQVRGKRRDINIGPAASISLADARRLSRKEREKAGATPGLIERPVPIFREAAKTTHKLRAAGYRNERHKASWLPSLETHVFPTIGDTPIDQVDRGDVTRLLQPIWLTTPETARRVLQRIDRVLRWAVGEGYRESSVDTQLVRDALPAQPRRRDRHYAAMPFAGVPAFYSALDYAACAPQIRAALRWLILTAARSGNVREARSEHIDKKSGIWDIPADAMKAGVAHRVPLPPAALSILAGLEYMRRRSDYIFTVRGKSVMSIDTMRMTLRRMGFDVTPHGFRSSFKGWSLETGWADHLSELAHLGYCRIKCVACGLTSQ